MKFGQKLFKQWQQKWKKSKLKKFSYQHPFTVVSLLFGVVMALIVAGNLIARFHRQDELKTSEPISVEIYHVGSAPVVKTLAKVTKENVWQVKAQTGGVFQESYVSEGDTVYPGTSLAYISSNYQGSSALVLQQQLALKNWQHTQDTFQTQLDIINQQRQLAEQQDINADELLKIQELSLDSTRGQIDLSKEILDELSTQLKTLEQLQASSPSATTQSSITALKAQQLQLKGGLAQLESGLRNTEYQVDPEHAPSKMSNLSKEMTLKQLELQEKGLTLNKEITQINYKLAQVNASLAYPASICTGVVQKVHVHRGEMIQPGTTLYTIQIEQGQTFVEVALSQKLAQQLSLLDDSYLLIDGQKIAVKPSFIPTEATDGLNYNVKFAVPEANWSDLTNQEFVEMELTLGMADTTANNPYLPIDAVYQTADRNFVFVAAPTEADNAEQYQAQSIAIELGPVYGQLVAVESGLPQDAQVILDRNVVEGDLVSPQ